MPNTIYMTPLAENIEAIYMDPLSELTGVVYMEPIEDVATSVLIGTYSFALTSAVVPADWDMYPGAYRNAAQTLTLPWASRVKIVPTGGYQICQNAPPPMGYAALCDFKTQIKYVEGKYNTASPKCARPYLSIIDAQNAWLDTGPIELTLGVDHKLAWGAQDSPLGDNTANAVTFQVYAIK